MAAVLFLLMCIKVSSPLHVYVHHDNPADDIENCVVCDLAVHNDQTDFLFIPAQITTVPLLHPQVKEPSFTYTTGLAASYLRSVYFGRPPPALA